MFSVILIKLKPAVEFDSCLFYSSVKKLIMLVFMVHIFRRNAFLPLGLSVRLVALKMYIINIIISMII